MATDTEVERQRPRLPPGDAVIDRAMVAPLVPRRTFGAHKWGVGGLLIVAGAPSFVGAAVLCAQGAGRAGAGVTNLAVPRGLVPAIVPAVPEAAYILLSETESTAGARRAAEMIVEKLEKSSAIVVGPGLGEDESAAGLLGALFGVTNASRPIGFGGSDSTGAGTSATKSSSPGPVVAAGKPMVLDADGLNWLAKQEGWHRLLPNGAAILTPHVGEMARLMDMEAAEITRNPVETAREAAQRCGQVVMLKYGFTAVSDGERVLVAEDAPGSLATGGAGDVLAGTIGALVAQGLDLMDAAAVAIYAGGRAARRVEQRFGTIGLVASDLPLAFAEELASLEQEGKSRAS